MKGRKALLPLLSTLIFGLGLATGLTAQQAGDSPQRVERKRTDLNRPGF